MDTVKWSHSVDCRSCINEINAAPKRKLELLIQNRKSCKKCSNCERLSDVKKLTGG
jgi:hypothetical protein